MNDDRRHDGNDRDAARALEALGRLPRSTPSNAARAKARDAFLSGAPADGPVVHRLPERKGGRSGRIWATFMAAAMFGMVAFLIVGSMSSEHWVVTDAGEGSSYAVGARLDPGVLTTGEGEELEVRLGDRLRIRLLAGTAVELPRPPGRWIDRVRGLTVTSGEIYGTTGGNPLGFPLTFVSDELRAKVTGTTFAVFRTDEASCVCLWEGGITVTPLIGTHDAVELSPQQRVWVYRDGREPDVMPLDPMEVMKLQMMSEAGIPEQD